MGLKEIRELKAAASQPKEKKFSRINPMSEKKKAQIAEQKESGTDAAMDRWFKYWMTNSEPVCEECGSRADWVKLPKYEHIWRACQAHILPKKKTMFPSLSLSLDNHIVLFPSWGGWLCGCHGFYDSSWFNASTMKIWGGIINVFKEKLFPLIPEKERKNIPEQLLKWIS